LLGIFQLSFLLVVLVLPVPELVPVVGRLFNVSLVISMTGFVVEGAVVEVDGLVVDVCVEPARVGTVEVVVVAGFVAVVVVAGLVVVVLAGVVVVVVLAGVVVVLAGVLVVGFVVVAVLRVGTEVVAALVVVVVGATTFVVVVAARVGTLCVAAARVGTAWLLVAATDTLLAVASRHIAENKILVRAPIKPHCDKCHFSVKTCSFCVKQSLLGVHFFADDLFSTRFRIGGA